MSWKRKHGSANQPEVVEEEINVNQQPRLDVNRLRSELLFGEQYLLTDFPTENCPIIRASFVRRFKDEYCFWLALQESEFLRLNEVRYREFVVRPVIDPISWYLYISDVRFVKTVTKKEFPESGLHLYVSDQGLSVRHHHRKDLSFLVNSVVPYSLNGVICYGIAVVGRRIGGRRQWWAYRFADMSSGVYEMTQVNDLNATLGPFRTYRQCTDMFGSTHFYGIFLRFDAKLVMEDTVYIKGGTRMTRTLFLGATLILLNVRFRFRLEKYNYTETFESLVEKGVIDNNIAHIRNPMLVLKNHPSSLNTLVWNLTVTEDLEGIRTAELCMQSVNSLTYIDYLDWSEGMDYVHTYQHTCEWQQIIMYSENRIPPKPICPQPIHRYAIEPRKLSIKKFNSGLHEVELYSETTKLRHVAYIWNRLVLARGFRAEVDDNDGGYCFVGTTNRYHCDYKDRNPEWYLYIKALLYTSFSDQIEEIGYRKRNFEFGHHLYLTSMSKLKTLQVLRDGAAFYRPLQVNSVIPLSRDNVMYYAMSFCSRDGPSRRFWWCYDDDQTTGYRAIASRHNYSDIITHWISSYRVSDYFGIFLPHGSRLILMDENPRIINWYNKKDKVYESKVKPFVKRQKDISTNQYNYTLFQSGTFFIGAMKPYVVFCDEKYVGNESNTVPKFYVGYSLRDLMLVNAIHKVPDRHVLVLNAIPSTISTLVWCLRNNAINREETVDTIDLSVPNRNALKLIQFMEWDRGVDYVQRYQSQYNWSEYIEYSDGRAIHAPFPNAEPLPTNQNTPLRELWNRNASQNFYRQAIN